MNRGRLLILLTLSYLVFSSCEDSTGPRDGKPSRWEIKPDSMNFAVLVLDFLTYTFEGGCLNYYDPCDKCGIDSIPFDIASRAPDDFGWMLFSYAPTGDTLFYATAIWMGTGEIEYPRNFVPPDSFSVKRRGISLPSEFELYSYFGSIYRHRDPTEGTLAMIDTCWSAINKLDIVHAFYSSGEFKVAFLMYHRVFGGLNTGSSKWVVFLFRENTILPSHSS
jgi:hypothetical protein